MSVSQTPTIAVLPGDGIGPEVVAAARRIADAAGLKARWQEHPVGWREWCERGNALPEATLVACREADALFLGAVTSKGEKQAQNELAPRLQGQGLRYVSPILRLRRELSLHVNIRPVAGNGMELTIFRENTEGLYAGHEAHPVPSEMQQTFPGLPTGPDAAVSLRLVTRGAIERLSRCALQHAESNGNLRVALVEKPNVLRATGTLVQETFETVANEYPGIETEVVNVDAACALMVRDPARFQVIAATNLFGDILSDLAAELAGGLSLAASVNQGDEHALFEPVHGSAPAIAGQGKANPIGAVRAMALMADHLGQNDVGNRIRRAVGAVLAEAALRTIDQGGTASTATVESALVDRLEADVVAR